MRIDSSGNVGIGTSSISTKLHVSGIGETAAPSTSGAKTATIYATASQNSANCGGAIEFGGQTSTTFAAWKGGLIDGTSNTVGYLAAYTRNAISDTSMTERLRIDYVGNVGIGTTSPANSLDVQNISTSQIRVGYVAGGATQYYDFGRDSSDGLFGFNGAQTSFVGYKWKIQGTEAMRINSSGNVGIGTTTTTNGKLSVTTATNYPGIFITDGTYSGAITPSGLGGMALVSNGAYSQIFYVNSAERMRIDASGYLLVNQTSSGGNNAQFQVSSASTNAGQFIVTTSSYPIVASQNGSGSGLIYFNYNATNIGTITTNGSATAYNTSSDYRLKNDVQPLSNGLATVSALNPVTYNWISNGSKGEGFIAHELQTVIPDAVTGTKDAVDADGKPVYQGVDYSKIVVHLVAAIQELSAKVTALESK
jgi:hypothetical protein